MGRGPHRRRPDILTTQQAAELLGVSRPHVVYLIEQGILPAWHVGSHRRLRASDVTAYRRRRDRALRDLTAEAQENGEYDRPSDLIVGLVLAAARAVLSQR